MRKPRTGYKEFQDRMFQELADLQDTRWQPKGEAQEKMWAAILKLGAIYGLTEREVRQLIKPGMGAEELRTAIESAKKKK
jgi:hypothetical protein